MGRGTAMSSILVSCKEKSTDGISDSAGFHMDLDRIFSNLYMCILFNFDYHSRNHNISIRLLYERFIGKHSWIQHNVGKGGLAYRQIDGWTTHIYRALRNSTKICCPNRCSRQISPGRSLPIKHGLLLGRMPYGLDPH